MGCTLAEGGYPAVQRWYDAIKARPATARGLGVLREQAVAGQRRREEGSLSARGVDNMFRHDPARGQPASKL